MSAKRGIDYGVGDIKRITIWPGAAFRMDDEEHRELQVVDADKDPEKPDLTAFIPEESYYEELLKRDETGTILRNQEGGAEIIGAVEADAILRQHTTQTIEKLIKRWVKREYEKCRDFARNLPEFDQDLQMKVELHKEWERRWSWWKYENVATAMANIEEHLNVASAPSAEAAQ